MPLTYIMTILQIVRCPKCSCNRLRLGDFWRYILLKTLVLSLERYSQFYRPIKMLLIRCSKNIFKIKNSYQSQSCKKGIFRAAIMNTIVNK